MAKILRKIEFIVETTLNFMASLEHVINLCYVVPVTEGERNNVCPQWTRQSNMVQTLIGNTCYVLVKTAKSWEAARNFCRGHSYNLVSFESSSKQGFIENWMMTTLGRASNNVIWTGGYRPSGGRNWLWTNDDRGSMVL